MVLQLSANSALDNYRVILTKVALNQSALLIGDGFNIVNSINIEYDIDTPLIEMSMILRQTIETNLINNGDIISIAAPVVDFEGNAPRVVIFRGYVFENIIEPESGELRIIVRNLGHWLTRDKFFFTLNAGETASHFIGRIALSANIPIARLDKTSYKMEKGKVYDGASYYDAFLEVMTITMNNEGNDYNLYVNPFGLVFEQVNVFPNSGKMWVFETAFRSPTMMNLQLNRSIMDIDFANVAVGYRSPNQGSGGLSLISSLFTGDSIVVKNQESINSFGTFQVDVNISQFNSENEARVHLQRIVDRKSKQVETVRFETFAIHSIKPLDKIMLIDRQSGVVGEYFIKHLTTRISDKKYRHEITATKRRNIPESVISQIISSENEVFKSISGLL